MEHQDILEKIQKQYQTLSKRQKLVADYILNNYDKAAFLAAGALAEASGVSESTVVRFASSFGFEGYQKLQKKLQESVKRKLTTVERMNLTDGQNIQDIIDDVLKIDISNLKTTRESLDIGVFHTVVEYLKEARMIYIIGYRASTPLATYLAFYLNYVFDNVKLVSAGAADIYTQLLHTGKEDVIIAVSFPRYAHQTVEGAVFAKSRGAKIVAITDNAMSPLYDLADVCVKAKSDMNFFVDSLVAPMSVINALLIAVGVAKREDFVKNFNDVERVWRDNGEFVKEKENPTEEGQNE